MDYSGSDPLEPGRCIDCGGAIDNALDWEGALNLACEGAMDLCMVIGKVHWTVSWKGEGAMRGGGILGRSDRIEERGKEQST
jgi:hypothetical protein